MTNQITAFNFDNSPLRVIPRDGEPWFVAADVCDALGLDNNRQAVARLDDDEKGVTTVDTPSGDQQMLVINESGLYSLILTSRKAEAKRFKKWVTSDVLPTIRKTGAYIAPVSGSNTNDVAQVARAFRQVVAAARSIGLDYNAAAVSANQVMMKVSGTNLLALMGRTHLPAATQAILYTPTELGKQFGDVSARKMNMLLAEAGLQARKGEYWEPLPAAEGFYRVLDTGKRHGDGTMVQQVKWMPNVLALVSQAA